MVDAGVPGASSLHLRRRRRRPAGLPCNAAMDMSSAPCSSRTWLLLCFSYDDVTIGVHDIAFLSGLSTLRIAHLCLDTRQDRTMPYLALQSSHPQLTAIPIDFRHLSMAMLAMRYIGVQHGCAVVALKVDC